MAAVADGKDANQRRRRADDEKKERAKRIGVEMGAEPGEAKRQDGVLRRPAASQERDGISGTEGGGERREGVDPDEGAATEESAQEARQPIEAKGKREQAQH